MSYDDDDDNWDEDVPEDVHVRIHEKVQIHIDTAANMVTLQVGYSMEAIQARLSVAEALQLIRGLEAAVRIARRAEPAS